jgi:hypothetical protein
MSDETPTVDSGGWAASITAVHDLLATVIRDGRIAEEDADALATAIAQLLRVAGEVVAQQGELIKQLCDDNDRIATTA